MVLDKDKFIAAIKSEDRDVAIEAFAVEHGMTSSGSDIMAVLKMVCEIGQPLLDQLCPLIVKP